MMTGIFDSGVGGLSVAAEVRRLCPRADLVYYADVKNAPYGTKTPAELLPLVRADIARLRAAGAEHILIACCTAGTVYQDLPQEERALCTPILEPTARAAARASSRGRIGILATEATVRASAFSPPLLRYRPDARLFPLAAQSFVSLVERAAVRETHRTGRCTPPAFPLTLHLTEKERTHIGAVLAPLRRAEIDTLLLGCTHFPHIASAISQALPGVRLISCAREGARAVCRCLPQDGAGVFRVLSAE